MRALAAAAAAILLLAACAGKAKEAAPKPTGWAAISTIVRGGAVGKLDYTGRWQFVTHRKDGRYAGASARAYTPGDSMSIVFRGARFRMYGITGRNGGEGLLLLPGVTSRTLSFYSTKPHVHALLFDSGTMPDVIHSAGIVVVGRGPNHKTGYVNIDEIEVDR